MDIDINPIMITLTERSRVVKAFFSGSIPLETEDHSWRAKAIKDLTTLCILRGVRHRYIAHQKRPTLNTDNEEQFLIEVDPLEDELLEFGSGNGETKHLVCITLKCELLQCIFCLSESCLGNCQKTSLFSRLDSLQRHVKTHTQSFTEGDIVYCQHPICRKRKIYLNGISHFKNHITLVHNIYL